MIKRSNALALDRTDPLKNKRKEFLLPKGKIYLDGNSLGIMPRKVPARVKHAVEVEWAQDLITSWNKHGWFNLPQVIAKKLSPLIGAGENNLIIADTISVNVFKVLSAALSLRPNRKIILSDSGNFPSDLYVAQGLTNFTNDGRKLKTVAPEDIAKNITQDVAVVMITEVDYRSCRRHDMKAITKLAHDNGALIIWDLAHSAGAIPVDLMAANADFAIGCTYKYLNGGPGAPAFAFVHPRHHQATPALVGWWGHAKPFAFAETYEPAPGILRYQVGTQAILNLAALDEAMNCWAGVDMNEVYAKAKAQCALFMELVETRVSGFGLELYGSRNWNERGSHLCLAHEQSYAIMQALIARGVVGDFRAPNLMRFGFAPLYNSYADVYDSVEILRDILETKSWDQPQFTTKKAVT